jgi:hypothetical protein
MFETTRVQKFIGLICVQQDVGNTVLWLQQSKFHRYVSRTWLSLILFVIYLVLKKKKKKTVIVVFVILFQHFDFVLNVLCCSVWLHYFHCDVLHSWNGSVEIYFVFFFHHVKVIYVAIDCVPYFVVYLSLLIVACLYDVVFVEIVHYKHRKFKLKLVAFKNDSIRTH